MKNQRRIKDDGRPSVYHLVTRTTNGEYLFDVGAKEVLRKMLRAAAEFSGVELLTYCIMENHFHAIVRSPPKHEADAAVADAELVRRFRVLYPEPTRYQPMSPEVLEKLLAAGGQEAEEIRARLVSRMHDISAYMKTVKQRFSVWFNRTRGRFGTLWAERFTSVLVEGSPGCAPGGRLNAQAVCAAYVDLNPVRAGLVDDPVDYRFCGYAEAAAGSAAARDGIARIFGEKDAVKALRIYRSLLFGRGASPARGKGGKARKINAERAKEVIASGGRLPLHELLRLRVRYFTAGAVLGSRAYLEQFFQENRGLFGPRRKVGARAMRGADWGELAVLRDLRDGFVDPKTKSLGG